MPKHKSNRAKRSSDSYDEDFVQPRRSYKNRQPFDKISLNNNPVAESLPPIPPKSSKSATASTKLTVKCVAKSTLSTTKTTAKFLPSDSEETVSPAPPPPKKASRKIFSSSSEDDDHVKKVDERSEITPSKTKTPVKFFWSDSGDSEERVSPAIPPPKKPTRKILSSSEDDDHVKKVDERSKISSRGVTCSKPTVVAKPKVVLPKKQEPKSVLPLGNGDNRITKNNTTGQSVVITFSNDAVPSPKTKKNTKTTSEVNARKVDQIPPNVPIKPIDLETFLRTIENNRLDESNVSPTIWRDCVKKSIGSPSPSAIPKCVVYWMVTEHRVQDNLTLHLAQKRAIETMAKLVVVKILEKETKLLLPTKRQFNFLIEGLRLVEEKLAATNIPFQVWVGNPKVLLKRICGMLEATEVFVDFAPVKSLKDMIHDAVNSLPQHIFCIEVDGRHLVPVWVACDKLSTKKSLHGTLNKLYNHYVKETPKIVYHFINTPQLMSTSKIPWEKLDALSSFLKIDASVVEITEVIDGKRQLMWPPGEAAALEKLYQFIFKDRYLQCNTDNTQPDLSSHLSPYLAFGFLSITRCFIELERYSMGSDKYKAFKTSGFLTREAAANYATYATNYNVTKTHIEKESQAVRSLRKHAKDVRPLRCERELMETATTAVPLWNSTQIELMRTGRIHPIFRRYWGNKLLAMTSTPNDAYETAEALNRKYAMDAADSSHIYGLAISQHSVDCNTEKSEVPIYGLVRTMNDNDFWCRKISIATYMNKYKHLT